jgi:LytS/YehU family sensor histidine kinase
MKFNINQKKQSTLLLHIIVWIVIFLLPFFFSSQNQYDSGKTKLYNNFLILNAVTQIFWMLLFYANTFLLIPRILYKRKYLLFITLQIVIFILIIGIHGFLFQLIVKTVPFNFLKSSLFNSIPFIVTVFASIAIKTVSDKIKTDRIANERQRENLKTELSFLRSQISPHFLFNVLNNLVSMARSKSEELEPTIHKLSSIMQYMLYETDGDKVLLKSEIDYLQSYIDLQKQRFGKKLTLTTNLNIKEDWHTIEPMLLIPFVENAFKHGIGMVQNPVIEITLEAENNTLLFVVNNKYISLDTVKDKVSGIGLNNVKRRLELLYGEDYQLTINKTEDWFTVNLQISFKS